MPTSQGCCEDKMIYLQYYVKIRNCYKNVRNIQHSLLSTILDVMSIQKFFTVAPVSKCKLSMKLNML